MQTLVSVIILCSNYNWQHSVRCTAPPDYFVVEENGEAWGHLTSGVQFTQTNVTNELGIRLQRFQMENAFWYVSNKGDIQADSDVEALSIYLSK